jgi:hypothetical protein
VSQSLQLGCLSVMGQLKRSRVSGGALRSAERWAAISSCPNARGLERGGPFLPAEAAHPYGVAPDQRRRTK